MTMMTYHLPLIIICVHIQVWKETLAILLLATRVQSLAGKGKGRLVWSANSYTYRISIILPFDSFMFASMGLLMWCIDDML
jgi:hypothetical protein